MGESSEGHATIVLGQAFLNAWIKAKGIRQL